jgi:hypothetical protein
MTLFSFKPKAIEELEFDVQLAYNQLISILFQEQFDTKMYIEKLNQLKLKIGLKLKASKKSGDTVSGDDVAKEIVCLVEADKTAKILCDNENIKKYMTQITFYLFDRISRDDFSDIQRAFISTLAVPQNILSNELFGEDACNDLFEQYDRKANYEYGLPLAVSEFINNNTPKNVNTSSHFSVISISQISETSSHYSETTIKKTSELIKICSTKLNNSLKRQNISFASATEENTQTQTSPNKNNNDANPYELQFAKISASLEKNKNNSDKKYTKRRDHLDNLWKEIIAAQGNLNNIQGAMRKTLIELDQPEFTSSKNYKYAIANINKMLLAEKYVNKFIKAFDGFKKQFYSDQLETIFQSLDKNKDNNADRYQKRREQFLKLFDELKKLASADLTSYSHADFQKLQNLFATAAETIERGDTEFKSSKNYGPTIIKINQKLQHESHIATNYSSLESLKHAVATMQVKFEEVFSKSNTSTHFGSGKIALDSAFTK